MNKANLIREHIEIMKEHISKINEAKDFKAMFDCECDYAQRLSDLVSRLIDQIPD